MNKTSLFHRYGTKLSLGFVALALFCTCMNGCATTTQSTASSKDSSTSSTTGNQLVGPDYYQSSDNPYHSD